MRRAIWRGPLLLLVLNAAILPGCSDGGEESGETTSTSAAASTTTVGVTEQEAIEIARGEVESSDPSFNFSQTRPVVIVAGDAYDVSFPDADPVGPGGEPHVLVDRTTGEVIDTYLTR